MCFFTIFFLCLFVQFLFYHWPEVIEQFPPRQPNYASGMSNFQYDRVLSSQSLKCYCNDRLVWWKYVVMHRWFDCPFSRWLLAVNHLWWPSMSMTRDRRHLTVILSTGTDSILEVLWKIFTFEKQNFMFKLSAKYTRNSRFVGRETNEQFRASNPIRMLNYRLSKWLNRMCVLVSNRKTLVAHWEYRK